MSTTNELINAELASDIANDKYAEERIYLYDIEKNPDKYRKFWTLTIYIDKLEGLNGQELVEVGNYIYDSEEDAESDVEALDIEIYKL